MDDYTERVRALMPAKALAIALYGESVASYRYRTLAEKLPDGKERSLFLAMADEEHAHHQRLQVVVRNHYTGSDFVLTPADKELVIVGPRMIDVNDAAARDRALNLIYESEKLTGRFYAALHDAIGVSELKPLLREMADECFEHATRIKSTGFDA